MTKPVKKPYGPLYQKAMKQHAAKNFSLTQATLNVLSALLTYTNGSTGQARPGKKALAEDTGIKSERTLDKALQTLRNLELIVPLAYANGGRGCATVYAFSLPAWTGQEFTPAINAEVREGPKTENPRNFCTKPPQNFPKTPAKNAAPTERTERTEVEDAPGGEGGNPERVPLGEHREVASSQLIQTLKERGIETEGLSYSEVRAEIQKLGYQIVRQKD